MLIDDVCVTADIDLSFSLFWMTDNYRGEYGIEDTRRALIEARHAGIHPYCITIDETAKDYLPHMYGAAAYTIVDDVAKLPLKVTDIYRRLTT